MANESVLFLSVFGQKPPDYISLDNLEQLGTNLKEGGAVPAAAAAVSEPFEAYKKRARAKYYSSNLAVRLANLGSPLQKSYWATYHCSGTLEQKGTEITSRYCGHRWCTVCNRIRTAQLMRGYEGPLSELKDLRFVTLTLPNVQGADLWATFRAMIKTAQAIQDYFKKRHKRGQQTWQLRGLRKLECTFSVLLGNFHPHFHFVIEGREAARQLVSEWLKRVPSATHKAQDERRAMKGTEKELFKYFAKLVTKVGKERATITEPLDVIFQAMRGLRVFQPIGIKKDVSEEIEELSAVQVEGIAPVLEHAYWQWFGMDWVNYETAEALTGYIPSEQAERLVKNIVRTAADVDQDTT